MSSPVPLIILYSIKLESNEKGLMNEIVRVGIMAGAINKTLIFRDLEVFAGSLGKVRARLEFLPHSLDKN